MMKKIFRFLGFKGTVVLFIFLTISLFCLQNLDTISVRFLFWDLVSIPKLTLVATASLLGVIVGFIFGWHAHDSKSTH